MLTYKYFSALSRNPQYNYNNEKTIQLLIQAKHGKNEHSKQRKKAELFYMMHQIIIMHMDIYKSMCSRDYDYDDRNSAFQRDDLISEFYIVFERCVKNYDLNKRDKKDKRINFYFYYKKSLMWCLNRLYHIHHKKLQDIQPIGWDNEWINNILRTENECDFIEFLMQKWGLTQQEQSIVESKLAGVPIKEYIDEFGITSSEYYKQLQNIKTKVNTLIYEGNFIHNQFVITKWFQDIGIGGKRQDSVLLAGERLSDTNQKFG